MERSDTDIVNVSHVPVQHALEIKDLGTKVALKGLDVTKIVYCRQVRLQVALLCEAFRADVTIKRPHVTNSMNSSLMHRQAA